MEEAAGDLVSQVPKLWNTSRSGAGVNLFLSTLLCFSFVYIHIRDTCAFVVSASAISRSTYFEFAAVFTDGGYGFIVAKAIVLPLPGTVASSSLASK